jgi:hypothetical protein
MGKKTFLVVVVALLLVLVQGIAMADDGAKTGPAVGTQGTINTPDGEGGPVCFSEDFEDGLGAWTLIDNSDPAGVIWVDTTDAVECAIPTSGVAPMPNWTSGAGEAACVSSDLHGQDHAIDTTMCTPAINLGAASSATLGFWANMQTFTSLDSLTVTVNGNVEATLLPALGAFQDVPGSYETVDLSAYAGNDSVEVCFTYVADWDWYVQVDEITITADVDDVRCDAVPTDVSLTAFDGGQGSNNWLPLLAVLLVTVVAAGGFVLRRQDSA